MNNKILIGIIVIIVVVALAFMLGSKNMQNQQSQPAPTQRIIDQKDKAEEVSIEVTTQGFVPQAIIIKMGTKVVWTNKSGGPVTVDSAQHPTHLVYPPLNLGQFENGSTVSLVFDKQGKYFYHNHLNPTQFGNVTVE